jgi:hypothetical protein
MKLKDYSKGSNVKSVYIKLVLCKANGLFLYIKRSGEVQVARFYQQPDRLRITL